MIKKSLYIREKVELQNRLSGFPLETCGNDAKQKQLFNIVILGLDPGIQGISKSNTKKPKLFNI